MQADSIYLLAPAKLEISALVSEIALTECFKVILHSNEHEELVQDTPSSES